MRVFNFAAGPATLRAQYRAASRRPTVTREATSGGVIQAARTYAGSTRATIRPSAARSHSAKPTTLKKMGTINPK